MSKVDSTIRLYVAELNKLEERINRTRLSRDKRDASKRKFDAYFEDSTGRQTALGILCIVAVLFDFLVNNRTIFALANTLGLDPEVLALPITILDCFVAIQASGVFEKGAPIVKERSIRTWRVILWTMSLVKIVLFVAYGDEDGNGLSALAAEGLDIIQMLSVFLPMILFIIVVYSILHLAGAGLWYVIGNVWFVLRFGFTTDPAPSVSKYNQRMMQLKNYCSVNGIDISTIGIELNPKMES
jgi:hypothetical protein